MSKVDETTREQHKRLRYDDQCWYFGNYVADGGDSTPAYKRGPTNQLISNFKANPTAAHRQIHKDHAIKEVARALRRQFSAAHLQRMTWVPVPPSKIEGHPEFDLRCLTVLRLAFSGMDADIRPLVRQTQSTQSDHTQGNRLTPEELAAILQVDEEQVQKAPVRERIVIFDDLLTTGKHFRCVAECLAAADIIRPVIGVFIARRELPNLASEFEGLDGV